MGSLLCVYYIIIAAIVVIISIVRVKGTVFSRATSFIILLSVLMTLFAYKRTEGFLDGNEKKIYVVSGHGVPLVDVYSGLPDNKLVYPLIDSTCI